MSTSLNDFAEFLTSERITVNGRDFDRWSNGKILPVVRGAAEGDPPSAESEDGGDETPPPKAGAGGEAAKFTQDDVNAAVQARLAKERRANETRLKEMFGDITPEDAAQLAKDRQAALEKDKSETEKAREEAAAAVARAAVVEGKAVESMRRADITVALVDAGVSKERMARATQTVLADLASLDTIDDDSIATVVAAVKTEMSEWFDGSRPTPPGNDPKGRLPGGKGNDGKSPLELGRERARTEREEYEKTAPKPLAGLTPLGG